MEVSPHDILEELQGSDKVLPDEFRFLIPFIPSNVGKDRPLKGHQAEFSLSQNLISCIKSCALFKAVFGDRIPHASRMILVAPFLCHLRRETQRRAFQPAIQICFLR